MRRHRAFSSCSVVFVSGSIAGFLAICEAHCLMKEQWIVFGCLWLELGGVVSVSAFLLGWRFRTAKLMVGTWSFVDTGVPAASIRQNFLVSMPIPFRMVGTLAHRLEGSVVVVVVV